jgi:ParB family chromosome partitioning protein
MGRGLAAILSASPQDDREELREVAVELVAPSPEQPRRSFDQEALLALAESIRHSGVLQPVLVRPLAGGRYELIAGERRWRAARIAQLETIPAIVRRREDAASLELALVENMVREDLNPVDEARACAALVDELGLTREEVGVRVGRSRVAVTNLIRLLDLPDEVLDQIERGELSEGHGRALLLTPDHAQRRFLARAAAQGRWSVRELEARARTAASEHPRRPPGRPPSRWHPDQAAAVAAIGDELGAALGCELTVTPERGPGYRVQLKFRSLDEALALAARLRGARDAA